MKQRPAVHTCSDMKIGIGDRCREFSIIMKKQNRQQFCLSSIPRTLFFLHVLFSSLNFSAASPFRYFCRPPVFPLFLTLLYSAFPRLPFFYSFQFNSSLNPYLLLVLYSFPLFLFNSVTPPHLISFPFPSFLFFLFQNYHPDRHPCMLHKRQS